MYDLLGCILLLKYLTDTSISPLQKEFVEKIDPYASNVCWSLLEFSVSILYVIFENVPVGKIHLVKGSLVKVLSDLCCVDNGIDMKRMKTLIHRYSVEILSLLENNPCSLITDSVSGHILYGNTNDDVCYAILLTEFYLIFLIKYIIDMIFFLSYIQLDQRLNNLRDLKKLENESETYWLNLLKNYFVNAPMVVVNGIPSVEKQRTLAQEEKERIAEQIAKLGPNGLEQKELELQQAIKENEVHIYI